MKPIYDTDTSRMSSSSRSPRPRGRPRRPETEDAILDAALRLLAEQGYGRLSFEGVAAAAGVSKPTLYRRWAGKADLAMAALARGIDVEEQPPAAGATGDRLVFVLRNLTHRLVRPGSMALVGTLLAEEARTPELIALFRDRVWKRRWQTLRRILDDGRARGEVRADADLDAAINLLIGAIYARHLSGASVPRDWPARTVSTVLRGIACDGSRGLAPRRETRQKRAR
jgi:AcrR family transcriptional regulator